MSRRIIADRAPSNHIVASVIKLLYKLTGGTIKWGYIPTSGGKGVRAISWVAEEGTPPPPRLYLHISGARRHKSPKMAASDAEIEISRPESYQSVGQWTATTTAALIVALGRMGVTVAAADADKKYLAAAAEARAAWERFNRYNSEISPEVHAYYDDCLKFSLH